MTNKQYEIECECGGDTAIIKSQIEGIIKSAPCENCTEEEKAAFIPQPDQKYIQIELECISCHKIHTITDETMLKVKEKEE